MALIWEKTAYKQHYEVRSAGNSIRLYTDGIFHSQWNPVQPLSGSLWDLLVIPAVAIKQPASNLGLRAAVLGVGGGAVLNQLNNFYSNCALEGVDLDKVHLQIARRFFGLRCKNIALTHSCATSWAKKAAKASKQFDYLVEDLFMGCKGSGNKNEAIRAIPFTKEWFNLLAGLVSVGGILVVNFESLKQFRQAVNQVNPKSCGFKSVLAITKPQYHNAIGVFSRSKLANNLRPQFTNNIEALGVLQSRNRKQVLNFTIRKG